MLSRVAQKTLSNKLSNLSNKLSKLSNKFTISLFERFTMHISILKVLGLCSKEVCLSHHLLEIFESGTRHNTQGCSGDTDLGNPAKN